MIPTAPIRLSYASPEAEDAARRDPRFKVVWRTTWALSVGLLLLAVAVGVVFRSPGWVTVLVCLDLVAIAVGSIASLATFVRLRDELQAFGGWSTVPPDRVGWYWTYGPGGCVLLEFVDPKWEHHASVTHWRGPVEIPLPPAIR